MDEKSLEASSSEWVVRDEAHLRTALDTSPTAAMMVSTDGVINLANAKMEALFGYARGGLTGCSVERLVPPEVRSHHPELRDAFFEYPSPRAMGTGRDLFGVARSGERIPIEIGLNPVRTDRGLQIMTTVLDIRERKRMEERFRGALDAAAAAIIMVDSAGTIVLCNALTEKVFGYPRSELVGQPIEKMIPPHLHRKHAVYRSSYVNEPIPRSMGQGRALRGLRADGTEFPVEVALQPVTTGDEQFVICSVLDISERRAAEQEIREKNAHLVKLNEELTAFAYSASHDLKAPLATIQGLARCIDEDLTDGVYDDVQKNVRRIEALSEKLSRLVEDVLLTARADRVEMVEESFRIDERVRASLERHVLLQEENGVEVDMSRVPPWAVVSQRERFDSVMDNLISNALRYADPEKQSKALHVEVKRFEEGILLVVRDNGLGVPEDMRERVFQMFERAHPTVTQGSGLGLALVRKHAARLGGHVDLSVEDGWTSFRFYVPLSTEPEEQGDP